MFRYTAYGLSIRCEFRLPELKPLDSGEDAADIIIRTDTVASLGSYPDGTPRHILATDNGISLMWDDIGRFLVRRGREIVVEPAPGAEERVVRLFTLGTSLAVLLHQRGLSVFHASAVEIAGAAAAFMGMNRTGKSTIAAALHAKGHDLVDDDILALDMEGPHPMALPGFPQFKLPPDSLACLGETADALPLLRDGHDKRARPVPNGFSQTPLPLKRVYLVEEAPAMAIETLGAQEAMLGLMPHWYGARFGMDLFQALNPSTHFRHCGAIARSVLVFRLKRGNDLSQLPHLTRMVESHLDQAE